MQKIVKNIDRVLLTAIPLISIPLLVLFNCREFWLAALFFVFCISSTSLLQLISLKFFNNIILAILGGTMLKVVFITAIFLLAAKIGGFNQTNLIASHLLAFLLAKYYELKILINPKSKAVSASMENK